MKSPQEIMPFGNSGNHSYHRRSFHHDYHNPFIYHIILKKKKGCEAFGRITGDARIPFGNPGCAAVNESPLGKIIAKTVLRLPHDYPIIKLHQFCVMPDHVHLLWQVLFHSDKHLDFYIDCLKEKIAKRYSNLRGESISADVIFEKGYCDKPLYDERSLDGWYRYIRENPHRLAMRKQYPGFFQRVRNLNIGNHECQAYGNIFLLKEMWLLPVRVHRRWSDAEFKAYKEECRSNISKGAIPVSPVIHPAEKEIMNDAIKAGSSVIFLTDRDFGDRYKPSGTRFDLCAEGRLLLLAPWQENTGRKSTSGYNEFHQMNDMALKIATIDSSTRTSIYM